MVQQFASRCTTTTGTFKFSSYGETFSQVIFTVEETVTRFHLFCIKLTVTHHLMLPHANAFYEDVLSTLELMRESTLYDFALDNHMVHIG